ncbi:MAG: AAA family ATPase [Desulfobacteraceae bacterium]|nr:AAA family ATPase [Desulfobacteraceae bacterium]
MKCPNCQADNPDTNKFCRKCGTKLSLVCRKCGSEVLADDSFCGDCGQDLGESKESPLIDYSKPQSYSPKHLKDKILTTRSSIEGERKLVTVFFADVANYTAMSEKLDPEEVHQIMDGCFKILMDEIHKYEGTINQFTGDGVMALFGAPVAHEDHAQRACHAALSVQRGMREYGEKIKTDTDVKFQMRIGLNSGHVIVGSIGDDLRMDYTAVGDTTNLASRMESAAKPGGILVSRNTQRTARHYFRFDALGQLEVKGKVEAQEVFELIASSDVETRFDASVAKGLTRFVGRKNSMAALMEPFERVQSGSGQVVGVVGEAGVGKTRLMREFYNRLTPGAYTYLTGQCIQYGESIIYLPILDIIKSYFEIEEGDQEFIIRKRIKEKILGLDEKLEHTIPSFQELLSLKTDDEEYLKLEPKVKRERTFEAIRDLFIRESQNNVLILVVEDLHWMDRTSEEFLDYLIEWLANARIMLILLYRTEYRHQWGSKTYYSKIGLDQLGAESSVELVKAMLETGEVVPEIRELILNRSAGNPLFMEEFTHSLLENGTIEKRDHQYVLSRDVSDIEVPGTIQGIIAARMDRLEENLKRTMQVASVIGREFAFRILQTIIEMREDLKANLLNLQGLEFIYEKSLFPELEYIFKHALTQEVAYNSLLQKRRKEIHENIGKAIEEIYPERLEEFYEILAYHYAESDNLEKAWRYLKLSGEKVFQRSSNRQAFIYFEEAIRKLNQLPQTTENKKEKVNVSLLAATAARPLAYPEGSLELLQEGERLSEEIGDGNSLAELYSQLGLYYSVHGDLSLADRYQEKCIYAAEKVKNVELMESLSFDLTLFSIISGNISKAIDIAPKNIALLEKTGKKSEFFGRSANSYAILCAMYGSSLAWMGQFEEGKKWHDKGLRFATDINHRETMGIVEFHFGVSALCQGDGNKTKSHFQNSINYLEEVQSILFLGMSYSGLGAGHFFLDEHEKALNYLEKGLNFQIDIKIPSFLSYHFFLLSLFHYELGKLEEAQRYIKEAVMLSQTNGEKMMEGISLATQGRIFGKMDPSHLEKAEECIRRGMTILDNLKLRPFFSLGYFFLGELYADTGQKEKALENLKKAEDNFREMGMDYWLNKTQKVLDSL